MWLPPFKRTIEWVKAKADADAPYCLCLETVKDPQHNGLTVFKGV
jgi:hypothetical protein